MRDSLLAKKIRRSSNGTIRLKFRPYIKRALKPITHLVWWSLSLHDCLLKSSAGHIKNIYCSILHKRISEVTLWLRVLGFRRFRPWFRIGKCHQRYSEKISTIAAWFGAPYKPEGRDGWISSSSISLPLLNLRRVLSGRIRYIARRPLGDKKSESIFRNQFRSFYSDRSSESARRRQDVFSGEPFVTADSSRSCNERTFYRLIFFDPWLIFQVFDHFVFVLGRILENNMKIIFLCVIQALIRKRVKWK